MAGLCLLIMLVPYAGYVALGPPSAIGLTLAISSLRAGDRRRIVLAGLVLNGLWLLLAVVFAWAILASLMDWPGGF